MKKDEQDKLDSFFQFLHPRYTGPVKIDYSTVLREDVAFENFDIMLCEMKKEYDVVIERDSAGYFVASVPALPGCHTQAKSLDELQQRIQEAIALCLDEYGSKGDSMEFVGIQRVTVDV